MRKNNKNNNMVTKDYLNKTLDDKLKNFVTKDYLDKTLDRKLKNYVTNDYLDERFDQYHGRIIKYINLRLEPIEENLKKLDSIDQRLDKILKTLDWLVTKYTKLDAENTIGFVQYKRVGEKIDNHEKRIIVLEKKATYKTS